MPRSFFKLPAGPSYALRHVHATDASGLLPCDLLIEHGRIAAMAPPGTLPPEAGPDLGGAMAWPGLIDAHAHLDKCHIWNRAPNPDGSHPGAVAAVMADRNARWTAEDVRRRMEFALQTAYAHGVTAIRTHLDSLAPQAAISWPVFRAVRDEWAGRIELQATSLMSVETFLTEQGRRWPISSPSPAAISASAHGWPALAPSRPSSMPHSTAPSSWRRSAASTSTCMSTSPATSVPAP